MTYVKKNQNLNMIHQNLNMIWGYTWIILRFKTLFRVPPGNVVRAALVTAAGWSAVGSGCDGLTMRRERGGAAALDNSGGGSSKGPPRSPPCL